jgi:hypothetical protein
MSNIKINLVVSQSPEICICINKAVHDYESNCVWDLHMRSFRVRTDVSEKRATSLRTELFGTEDVGSIYLRNVFTYVT